MAISLSGQGADTGGEIRKALKLFHKCAFQLKVLRIFC